MKKILQLTAYYLMVILYLEIGHSYFLYQNVFHIGLLYLSIFSIFISLILAVLSSLGHEKTNRITIGIITVLLSLIFAGNYLYTTLFSVPFTIYVTQMASQAMDFTNVIFLTIIEHLHPLWIFLVPILFYILCFKKIRIPHIYFYEKKIALESIIAVYILSLLIMIPNMHESKSAFQLYWKDNDLISAIDKLGLLTAEMIDINRAIFGFEQDIVLMPHIPGQENAEVEYNKMDIDFEKLKNEETDNYLKSLYTYFNEEMPTNKNEYTGKYQGKNLIFILAESFNTIAISQELTPTLYQLTNSGFHFTNFYSPVFLSTTGGEFQSMTGLVPSAETLSAWYKGTVYLPFSLGNAFGKQNYTANAYHNWTNMYYNRDKTMPTLGFDNFLSCESGLEERIKCVWEGYEVPSDKEMIDTTIADYAEKTPFVSFYITVSGHMPYYFSDRKRNYDAVKDLPYSEKVKGYLQTQIDLDKALESLINQLKEKNILDDTVICLVGDHYPYALSVDEINELSNYPRDGLFEINHSDLIIWNNDTEKIEIDKVGSQIDVLPTLLNLFGIEYDSRLMIGHDILSDTEGLAIFSDLSWISDSGSYVSKTKQFTPTKEVSEDYVTNKNQWVNNSVVISKRIIEQDVYRKIFSREEE